MTKLILLPLALLVQEPGPAARPELSTDRPDFTEGAAAVPQGTFQIEMGSTWERAEGRSSLGGTETLVRWGAGRFLELRFGLPDARRMDGAWTRSDASIGMKLPLSVGQRAWEWALLSELAIQVGDGPDTDPVGLFILTTGRDFGDRWTLGTQASLALTHDPERGLSWGSTAVLGRAITDALSTFGELALDGWEEGERALTLHHGYSYLVRPALQLDVHAGVGLSDIAADVLVGLGLSARFGG